MTTATRVYVARLAGLPVFDPNGDQVGRVRDAVARLRTTNRPPQVVGLVAEMPLRRRIFLPIGRITSIDADAVVLSTGTLNLRRFEKRPDELLVLEDLLDRRVTIDARRPDRRPWSTSAWRPTAPASGRWPRSPSASTTGRLTRRGHLHQVEWDRGPRPDRPARHPGHGQPARRARADAPRRPGQRAAGPAGRPPQRGRRRPRRRAAGRRARGAARARPGGDPRPRSTGSAPPTSWRRWTRTTPPTCSPSCPSRSRRCCST